MATRGFSGKGRPASTNGRLPPGQFITEDFPVLSAGPDAAGSRSKIGASR